MTPTSQVGGSGGGSTMTLTPGKTQPVYVKLISDDGFEFVLERETALYSRTLAMFLDTSLGWEEALGGQVVLKGISGKLLSRVCSFLHHRRTFENSEHHPPWEITAEESLDLLLVADYLEM